MLPPLAALSPNALVLLFTVGIALIAVELNRLGRVLPGALGLLLALLTAASLWQRHPSKTAVIGCLFAMGLLLVQARWPIHPVLAAVLTIVLVICLGHLRLQDASTLSPTVAVLCGAFFGAGITLLTRIARRARRNKGLD